MAELEFTNGLAEAEEWYASLGRTNHEKRDLAQVLGMVASLDARPAYRSKWNLAEDPKFEEGVVYMASLNSKEPACSVGLGIACWRKGQLNLAKAAFEKAIQLGSTQSETLQMNIAGIDGFLGQAHYSYLPFLPRSSNPLLFLVVVSLIPIFILCFIASRIRRGRRQSGVHPEVVGKSQFQRS